MAQIVAKRLGAMALLTVALSAVVFLLQKLSPLDPVKAMLGPNASPSAVAAQRARLGLDQPILTQYGNYLAGLLHGDLGMSYRTRRPVAEDLATFVPATAELALFAMLLAIVLAIVLAVSSSLRWPGAILVRGLLLAGASAPSFLIGIGALLLFYAKLGWLPGSGRAESAATTSGPTGLFVIDGLLNGDLALTGQALSHLVLPALAISFGPAVAIGRVLRSSLLGETQAEYSRTARAKGLSEPQVLRRHVLRNAIGPALSMTGLQVGLMFAGVLVVEQVFSWPGVGQYTAASIPVADFPAIAGVTLLLGIGYVAVNTVVDLLQAVADPRIKT